MADKSFSDWRSDSELSPDELAVLDSLDFEPAPDAELIDLTDGGPTDHDLTDHDLTDHDLADHGLADHALTDQDLADLDERLRRRIERVCDVWAVCAVVAGLVGVFAFASVAPSMVLASVFVVAGAGSYLVARRRDRQGDAPS